MRRGCVHPVAIIDWPTRQVERLETAAQGMLARHRANDIRPVEAGLDEKRVHRIEHLQRDATELRDGLKRNPEDRKGAKGSSERQAARLVG